MHLTLDRIADDLCRLGADLSATTMCDAMGHVAALVEPLCDAILDELLVSGLVHLDGSGVKVLMPGEKGSYRGQFTVVSNSEATAYCFSETKEGHHLADFLRIGTPRLPRLPRGRRCLQLEPARRRRYSAIIPNCRWRERRPPLPY